MALVPRVGRLTKVMSSIERPFKYSFSFLIVVSMPQFAHSHIKRIYTGKSGLQLLLDKMAHREDHVNSLRLSANRRKSQLLFFSCDQVTKVYTTAGSLQFSYFSFLPIQLICFSVHSSYCRCLLYFFYLHRSFRGLFNTATAF